MLCSPMAEGVSATWETGEVNRSGLAGIGHIEAGIVADPFHNAMLDRSSCHPAKVVIVNVNWVLTFVDPD